MFCLNSALYIVRSWNCLESDCSHFYEYPTFIILKTFFLFERNYDGEQGKESYRIAYIFMEYSYHVGRRCGLTFEFATEFVKV